MTKWTAFRHQLLKKFNVRSVSTQAFMLTGGHSENGRERTEILRSLNAELGIENWV